MNKHILINASNLHAGGGVQVATSIVDELSRRDGQQNISLVLSNPVMAACKKIDMNLRGFRHVETLDVRGFESRNATLERLFGEADVVFTVFGPLYTMTRPKKSVVGFAQPWIIYPGSDAHRKLPFAERMKVRARYFLQKLAFRRNSDLLVVEADHVSKRLKAILPSTPSVVVPNALNAVFRRAIEGLPDETGAKSELNKRAGETKAITLGYVGRAYSHKNVEVLAGVSKALRGRYGIGATIKVTLNDAEWAAQSDEFRAEIEQVGSMSLDQLVEFYRSLDGVIFPSLLECFSATPLEVMAMGIPLYASDRPFVRDFSADYPFYFDPLDPDDIADAIARSLELPAAELQARLQAARSHVFNLPTATDRARKTVELLHSL
ncbi:glycosyltransferase [Qipengyuania flava]|jgi:glycosyltransferase involved in cell wall biosynthesis|uniref:glycosyltransferase n=1 Tax=Qipengyuania flava TaxID=192812 RepID=UPI001C57CE47|nr:glycosyltransferase [Qipengyuania flava]MBW3168694.1 glycosyltransferase [Qipengyuania flava]MBY5965932.1 glycosyltransferase [Qipengyuania flava]MBY6012256.1 glycosyltransferase [Qipengyuania flava]MBY6026698.1 glycosyltransferase [Qipengyuania flava]